MIKRYVNDLNALLTALRPGTRYNAREGKLEIREEMIAADMKIEKDDYTMSVFKDIANSVNPSIEVEVDFPSKNDDKFMPILDMKFAVNEKNEVVYKFFKKPMANNITIMANSALSDRVKRSTMTNEASRRLLC